MCSDQQYNVINDIGNNKNTIYNTCICYIILWLMVNSGNNKHLLSYDIKKAIIIMIHFI